MLNFFNKKLLLRKIIRRTGKFSDKIFEPFFTERSGETGLGLYISRELCELNRATLVYRTSDAGGSIFQVVFADPDRWEDIKD